MKKTIVAMAAMLVAMGMSAQQNISFREGKLGVMDYYNMRNIQADTQMRESIGGTASTKAPQE